MNSVDEYLEYEDNEYFIDDLKKVIASGDEEELNDRFYTSLVFGTGGFAAR